MVHCVYLPRRAVCQQATYLCHYSLSEFCEISVFRDAPRPLVPA